jgi:hypothetical protein
MADSLALNANIDVSGKGYRGAAPTQWNTCCAGDNSSELLQYDVNEADSLGLLGESFLFQTAGWYYYRGVGGPLAFAGGGAGANAGGGGGANYGGGGDAASQVCNSNLKPQGGYPQSAVYSSIREYFRIFMGGGGGGGTHSSDKASSTGGNGGGVVIIIGRKLFGNNFEIRSNGLAPSSDCTGGAGGGGSGGTILISVSSIKSNISASVKGGNGGNGGRGGGPGGGGYIGTYGSVATNITPFLIAGNSGTSSIAGGALASSGTGGKFDTNFQLQGRGLLNNFYEPEWDTICDNNLPKLITPSTPSGGFGAGTYRYEWVKKDATLTGFVAAGGNDSSLTFQPLPLTRTTSYKRYVFSVNPYDIFDELADSSIGAEYTVVVYPAITNSISETDSVCSGITKKLTGSNSTGGDPGKTIKYIWQCDSAGFGNTTFTRSLAVNKNETAIKSYQYRRISYNEISGVYNPDLCNSVSNTIKLTYFPVITGNNLPGSLDTTVCQDLHAQVSGTRPQGGNGSLNKYSWMNGYIPGSGDTLQNFQSPVLISDLLMRRKVYFMSGADTVCSSISNPKEIKVLPRISNNIISHPDFLACQDAPVKLISGLNPAGGQQGNFTYFWERTADTTGAWTLMDTKYVQSETNYNPLPFSGSDITWFFRRKAWSGLNNTCKNTSNVIPIFVQPKISGNIIDLEIAGKDTLCFGDTLPRLINKPTSIPAGGDGNVYHYTWLSTLGGLSGKDTLISYLYPSQLTAGDFLIRRIVYSGVCRDTSSQIKIKVYPAISNNILIPSDTVCINTTPGQLSAGAPAGGEGSYEYEWWWKKDADWVSLGNTTAGFVPDSNDLGGTIIYRRNVYSPSDKRVCKSEATTTIAVWPRPSASLLFPSAVLDTSCSGEPVDLKFTATSGLPPFKLSYAWDYSGQSGSNPSGNTIWHEEIPSMDLTFSNIPQPLLGDSIAGFVYMPAELLDSRGCIARVDSGELTGDANLNRVIVYKIPTISNFISDTTVCADSLVLFADNDIGRGEWRFSGAAVPFWATIDSPGNKQALLARKNDLTACDSTYVTWRVINNICKDSSTSFIRLLRHYPVNGVITPDDTLFYPERDTIRVIPFDSKYESGLWNIIPMQDQQIPIISREDTSGLWISLEKKNFGDYKFVWTVDNGVCPTQADTAYHSYYNILVYDGFSPNWDQYNQYLICEGISNIDQYELTIVNRLGEKVYTWSRTDRNDKPFPGEPEAIWDGNNNNGKALPEGTYYYILKVNGVHYKKDNKITHYVVLRRKS